MQLIKDGPEVPDEVLQALDAQRLVFFCGSGISLYTGLPLFKGLADNIWTSVQPVDPQTPAEIAAYKANAYDRFLGLLEQRLVPGKVRRAAIKHLSSKYAGTLDFHKALLKLSTLRDGGIRLITTNFDLRFLEAGLDIKLVDRAPYLPVPKFGKWRTAVYLHGIIRAKDPEGQDLILTHADFGRAYLTEGWASRFLTDLFRDFVVVFIGYSIEDPIVSYMMSALAAERSTSDQFRPAFAFGSYDGTSHDKSSQDALWRSKGVEPILFDRKDDFALLSGSVIELSKLYVGSESFREAIIDKTKHIPPKGPSDTFAQQVCWALNDGTGATARKFCKLSPKPALDWWLDAFDQIIVSSADGKTFSGKLTELPTVSYLPVPYAPIKTCTPVAGHTRELVPPVPLHPVTSALLGWLVEYLQDPRLLAWVIGKGNRLHPLLLDLIRQNLVSQTFKSEALKRAWELVSSRALWGIDESYYCPPEQLCLRRSDGSFDPLALHEFLKNLSPQLKLKPAAPWWAKAKEPTVRIYIDGEVILRGENYFHDLESLITKDANPDELLEVLADRLTTLLVETMFLYSLVDKVGIEFDYTHGVRSVSKHNQDEFAEGWTALIGITRDAGNAIARRGTSNADKLLTRWMGIPFPIFKRLSLNLITENLDIDTSPAIEILSADDKRWLWSPHTHRECLRFLRKAGHRLRPGKLNILERAICQGPPTDFLEENLAQEKLEEYTRFQIWLRLLKLEESGARLSNKAKSALKSANKNGDFKVTPDFRDEFLSWTGPVEWLGNKNELDQEILRRITPAECAEAFIAKDHEFLDELAYIAYERPHVLRRCLIILPPNLRFNVVLWGKIMMNLRALRGTRKARRVWLLFRQFFMTADNDLINSKGNQIARWLSEYSREVRLMELEDFARIWCRAWIVVEKEGVDLSFDPVSTTINSAAGQLGESLSIVLRLIPGLTKDSAIPTQLKDCFELIARADGSAAIMAKTALAMDLAVLWWMAPNWVKTNLFSNMDWQEEQTSCYLWSGYLSQFRYFPDLVSAYKDIFMKTLEKCRNVKGAGFGNNLVMLLSALLVNCPDCFTQEDFVQISMRLKDLGLEDFGHELTARLREAGSKAPQLWSEKVKPLVVQIWPADFQCQTPQTSVALAHLAVQSGEKFKEAVGMLNPFFVKGSEDVDQLLYEMLKSDLPNLFPEAVTECLSKIISETTESWKLHRLKEIVEKLKAANPQADKDPNLRYLAGLCKT